MKSVGTKVGVTSCCFTAAGIKGVVVALFLIFASCQTLQGGTIYTVNTEHLPPFSTYKGGEVGGIATEIVQRVFDQAGVDFTIKAFPWKRAYENVQEDRNSFIYALGRNETRENHFQWIGPIMIRELAFFGLSERKDIVAVDTFEQLQKYKIGVMNGESTHQILLEHGFVEKKNIFPVAKIVQNAKMLFARRIDLIPENNYTIGMQVEAMGHSIDTVKKVFTIMEGGYYIGANIDVPKNVVRRLQESLEKVKKSDFVEELHRKYKLSYNQKLYKKYGFGL